MKGVLDRIEDNQHAVILIEGHNKEVIIPKAQLPTGSEVHAWFDLTLEGDTVTSIQLDKRTTEAQQSKTDDLMSTIRAKGKGSKFKRR